MEYSYLGNTSLLVSRIGLGCELIGGTDWGDVNVREASRAIQLAAELGVNLFDTADVYGLGLSETRLATALGNSRKDMVIVTKGGHRWNKQDPKTRAKIRVDASRAYLRKSIEGSLKRLRLEKIPIYLHHRPDPTIPLEETISELSRNVAAGKIGYFGLSNYSLEEIRRAEQISSIPVIENCFNIFCNNQDRKILQYADSRKIGFFAYGVLAQGLLSGNYGKETEFGEKDRPHRLPLFSQANLCKMEPIFYQFSLLAIKMGCKTSRLAIEWVLNNKGITSAIVGVRSRQQVYDNLAEPTASISKKEISLIKKGSFEFFMGKPIDYNGSGRT